MGAEESKHSSSGTVERIVAIERDGYPLIEVPQNATLQDLLTMWVEDGKPDNYKECTTNLRDLIEVQDRVSKMKRKGEKYGEAIREWVQAAQLVTNTIPSYSSYNKVEYFRSKKVICYYNEIMSRGEGDFLSFAGSLTPKVVSKKSIDEVIIKVRALLPGLNIDQKDGPRESDLLEAALMLTDSLPQLMSFAEKFVDDEDTVWRAIEDLEREVNSMCVARVSEKNMATLANNLESYCENFILLCKENESIGTRVTRILELAKNGPEALEIKKSPRCLLDLQAAKLLKAGHQNTVLEKLTKKISSAADRLTDVLSAEADSIVLKLTKPTVKWRDDFNKISKQQINELRNNASVNQELKKNNMSILYISWSDVGRAQGSCGGPNITDMQFFAVPPRILRPAAPRYQDLDKGLFCNFPAVRSPNFTDEVDIRTASNYSFKVRDLQGDVNDVTMTFFLKNIGRYITDLEPDANWGDEIDLKKEKMQVASQFSVLPLLECANHKVDLGISAFGYQKKNLHIIIGPNGDLGWAPEGPGYKRIFFRDTAGIMDAVVSACDPYFGGSKYICNLIARFVLGFGQELRAIALVPEDRQEVSRSFFKAPVINESIEEEAQRYAKVENKLIHIQIEMVRGEEKSDFVANEMFTCDGLTQIAKDLKSKKNVLSRVSRIRKKISQEMENEVNSHQLDYKSVIHKDLPNPYMLTGQARDIAYGSCFAEFGTCESYQLPSIGSAMCSSIGSAMCSLDTAARFSEARRASRGHPNLGLLLARVQMGDSVGRADHTDSIPFGSKRSKGVAVRVTEMFYSVAKNAKFTQPRIYRFMQQMSFAKRAGDLAHGSLVTGQGSWGTKLPPITLAKGY